MKLGPVLIRQQIIKIKHGIGPGDNPDDLALFHDRNPAHIMLILRQAHGKSVDVALFRQLILIFAVTDSKKDR